MAEYREAYVDWEAKGRSGHIKIDISKAWATDRVLKADLPRIVACCQAIVDEYIATEGLTRKQYMQGESTKVYLDVSCNLFSDHTVIDELTKKLRKNSFKF